MVGFQISYLFNTYWPVKLLDIKTPLPVLTPRVKAGEDLIYHADYCRYFKGNVKVFRSFIGPSVINLPSIDSITDPGCRVVDIHLTIPIYAVSGQYKMKAIAEFQVT